MQLLPAPSMATEVMAARDLSVAALVDAVGLGLRLQAFSLHGEPCGGHAPNVRLLHAQSGDTHTTRHYTNEWMPQ